MKKSLLLGLCAAFVFAPAFCGDVATFVDKGFTADGKYYIFGQYGKTDKKYQGYAEIYQVDIAANDYVDAGVFKTKPGNATASKNGKEVYEELEAKSFYYLKNLPCETADSEHTLYILEDIYKTGSDEIEFKDFENSKIESPDTYRIKLVPSVTGSGKKAKSSLYINIEKYAADGTLLAKTTAGNPGIARKGVVNYKIERIFCDKAEKNLIFVIEKMIEDDTGVSFRYMVEAVKIK